MTCLFRAIFYVPCPTCGVTRAMLRLLALDWQGYLHYNAMALPLCIALTAFFIAEKCRMPSVKILCLLVFLCNVPYYACRLVNGEIP